MQAEAAQGGQPPHPMLSGFTARHPLGVTSGGIMLVGCHMRWRRTHARHRDAEIDMRMCTERKGMNFVSAELMHGKFLV